MSRKNKAEVVLPQFKHLRFADVSAIEQAAELDEKDRRRVNVLSNLGGYTLAFRIFDLSKQSEAVQAEWEDAGPNAFLLSYAWAECYFDDNFNRHLGRSVSQARLRNMAPDWSHTTILELGTAVMPDQIIVRNIETGEVDLKGHEKDIAKALIHNFIDEQQQFLFNGADLDSYKDFLVEYNGQYVIDSTVLLTGPIDTDDVDDLSDETVDVAEDGKAALHSLAALLAPEVRGQYNIPQPIIDQMMCHLADTNAAFDQIIELNSDTGDNTDDDDEDDSDLPEDDEDDEGGEGAGSDDEDDDSDGEDEDDDEQSDATDDDEDDALDEKEAEDGDDEAQPVTTAESEKAAQK